MLMAAQPTTTPPKSVLALRTDHPELCRPKSKFLWAGYKNVFPATTEMKVYGGGAF